MQPTSKISGSRSGSGGARGHAAHHGELVLIDEHVEIFFCELNHVRCARHRNNQCQRGSSETCHNACSKAGLPSSEVQGSCWSGGSSNVQAGTTLRQSQPRSRSQPQCGAALCLFTTYAANDRYSCTSSTAVARVASSRRGQKLMAFGGPDRENSSKVAGVWRAHVV